MAERALWQKICDYLKKENNRPNMAFLKEMGANQTVLDYIEETPWNTDPPIIKRLCDEEKTFKTYIDCPTDYELHQIARYTTDPIETEFSFNGDPFNKDDLLLRLKVDQIVKLEFETTDERSYTLESSVIRVVSGANYVTLVASAGDANFSVQFSVSSSPYNRTLIQLPLPSEYNTLTKNDIAELELSVC